MSKPLIRFPAPAVCAARLVLCLGLAVVLVGPLSAEAPDETNMGRLIQRNQSNLRYFDNVVSNLPLEDGQGNPNSLRADIIERYRLALQHDFHANLWYMQGNYSGTRKELKISMDHLQQAYERTLRFYNDTTASLLDGAAPLVVRMRDSYGKYFLKKGYANLEHARAFRLRGYNINPNYHKNQLYYYRQGIKHARAARRYAVLAMIEARLPLEEREQFRQISYDEIRSPEGRKQPPLNDYGRVSTLLRNLITQKRIPATVTSRNLAEPVTLILMEVHQDNYNRRIDTRDSVWLELTSKLDSRQFYTDYVLPRRNTENRNELGPEDSDPLVPPENEDDANDGAGDDNAQPTGYQDVLDMQAPVAGDGLIDEAGDDLEDSYF